MEAKLMDAHDELCKALGGDYANGAYWTYECVLEAARRLNAPPVEEPTIVALRARAHEDEVRIRALEEGLRDAEHVVRQACTFASPEWRRNALSLADKLRLLAEGGKGTKTDDNYIADGGE